MFIAENSVFAPEKKALDSIPVPDDRGAGAHRKSAHKDSMCDKRKRERTRFPARITHFLCVNSGLTTLSA